MRKQITKIFFILTAFLMAPFFASATTPTISNVAGTVATGQTLTIVGTTMVDENKTNWLGGTYSFKTGTTYGFEGNDYLSDGYFAAPDSNRQEPTYDTAVKIMGNKSYKGRIQGCWGWTNSPTCPPSGEAGNYTTNASSGGGIYMSDFEASVTGDYYIRMYTRWHSPGTWKWADSHVKMLDMQGSGGGTEQYYVQPMPLNTSTLPTQMNLTYDSTPHGYDVANFMQDNRWYSVEARFKNTSPHNLTVWVDGVQIASVVPTGTCNIDSILFNMINLSGTGTDTDLTNWTDAFTVSTTRVYPAAIIEISNNATYGAGTVVKQEPLYLNDGSVQIKADLTGLGGGPYYLFVTNNRQETSAGFLLGSSDTTAPASPSGLSVS